MIIDIITNYTFLDQVFGIKNTELEKRHLLIMLIQNNFIFFQASSSLFLVIACLTFKKNINLNFKIGAWCNAIVSFIYNGMQVPCEYNVSTISCSYIEHRGEGFFGLSMKTWKKIDLFFVCFVCLYTGYQNTLPTIIICAIASWFGQVSTTLVVFLGFFLTLHKISNLNNTTQYIFYTGAVIGPIVFIACPKDRWLWPLRFMWHFCCMLLIYVGSLLVK